MIATQFYFGQGLGNQLFCYVVSKSLAFDKKMDVNIYPNPSNDFITINSSTNISLISIFNNIPKRIISYLGMIKMRK